jgi:hypothetical protein
MLDSNHRHVLATYQFGALKRHGENNVNADDNSSEKVI